MSESVGSDQGKDESPTPVGAKRVHYVNTNFLTDERIADALMNYSSALAIVNASDVVRVPGMGEDGKLHAYELVIGPASQLMSVDEDSTLPAGLPVEEVVADLVNRSEQRLPSSVELARDIWDDLLA